MTLYRARVEVHGPGATTYPCVMTVVQAMVLADVFDRSSTGRFPFAANLVANVERCGLRVDTLVGLHGRPVTFADVIAAAASTR